MARTIRLVGSAVPFLGPLWLFIFLVGLGPDFTSADQTMQKTTSKLYRVIGGSSVSDRPNFVFSPFSIMSVFNLAERGAEEETLKEMEQFVAKNAVFKIPSFPKQDSSKDMIFRSFQKEVCSPLGYDAEIVDFSQTFAAANTINSYVQRATHDHIRDLISAHDLNQFVHLVLVNGLYFKAPWASQFSQEQSNKGMFRAYRGDGVYEEQTVICMNQLLKKQRALYTEDDGVMAFGLEYEDSRLMMLIVVPDDIEDFERHADSNPTVFDGLVEKMENHDANNRGKALEVTMPRFKLTAADNKADLEKAFRTLGATKMFTPGVADFGGISSEELHVSAFHHQADIDVDEKGTEAAAASAVVMMMRSMPLPKEPLPVVVDKPFVFQVRMKLDDVDSTYVLFTGRIADAAAAQ